PPRAAEGALAPRGGALDLRRAALRVDDRQRPEKAVAGPARADDLARVRDRLLRARADLADPARAALGRGHGRGGSPALPPGSAPLCGDLLRPVGRLRRPHPGARPRRRLGTPHRPEPALLRLLGAVRLLPLLPRARLRSGSGSGGAAAE